MRDAYKALSDKGFAEPDVDDVALPGDSYVDFAFKDKVPAGLFLGNVAVVVYLAVVWGAPNIGTFDFTQHKSGDEKRSQGMSLLVVAGLMGAVGAVLSALWLQALHLYAVRIISVTLQATVAALLVGAVAGFMEAGLAGQAIGLGNLFLAVALGLYYISVRHRIPFAAANLAVASKIMQRFPQIALTAYAAIAAQVVWTSLWTVALVGVWVIAYKDGGAMESLPSSTTTHFCVFLMLLSLFWGLQVLRNVVHCTAAGTVGEWWFSPHPEGAARRALRRCVTTSFGSICFGSLIVAALAALRFVLLTAKRRKSRGSVNACLDCLVGALESNLKIFNKYAYVQVALYGKSLYDAGLDTMLLFREKGWTAVVNESLVSSVLSTGCVVVGLATGLVGVGLVHATTACSDAEAHAHEGQCDTFSVLLTTFAICNAVGYAMCAVVSSILDSIVATVFVCFAEDPVALHITNSDEYMGIVDAWRQFHPELLTHSTFSASVSYA
ncbi:hypothetical protein SPRG_20793 [Saprolegnia parasitica CBS 223.65]|uniref:Choline transporter-like protein n=1 Tax=Saprolegnia parasitica (strain CBS 223.65) TaxID=695850 RepID=A0A067C7V6_SAPPC|nr:hypothetical protein SPRG_20793 [Saprolegnia parasitica CBS 223.65]KDO25215.1 hypothetical protein SPRG_20793 [Saprolegnia parasitica CBS 223.65]|eukprot:XP_012204120.1 hypothetical protein SPRG_20793 [Saprolegnia parasitica CBS 223.65]